MANDVEKLFRCLLAIAYLLLKNVYSNLLSVLLIGLSMFEAASEQQVESLLYLIIESFLHIE